MALDTGCADVVLEGVLACEAALAAAQEGDRAAPEGTLAEELAGTPTARSA
ncbi:hypothetical protein [Streptomyces sp. NPDC056672]|uniref:hypothetical protein n=1 Tax=Streptomyces sp. NPDC056672 TaxID=3345906 RepID=UPI003694FD5D